MFWTFVEQVGHATARRRRLRLRLVWGRLGWTCFRKVSHFLQLVRLSVRGRSKEFLRKDAVDMLTLWVATLETNQSGSHLLVY